MTKKTKKTEREVSGKLQSLIKKNSKMKTDYDKLRAKGLIRKIDFFEDHKINSDQ